MVGSPVCASGPPPRTREGGSGGISLIGRLLGRAHPGGWWEAVTEKEGGSRGQEAEKWRLSYIDVGGGSGNGDETAQRRRPLYCDEEK